MTGKSFYLDGREIAFDAPMFAGAHLLRSLGKNVVLPGPNEPPYLFCGNGACWDCNLLVDGFPDLPACRIPLAPGMSIRSGEGAGEENALSRHLGEPSAGAPLITDVLVVGAGPAGRAASEAARTLGAETILVDVRAFDASGVQSLCPVGVVDGRLVVFERGLARPARASAVVLANGARDASPGFPGAALAGVLPLDLLERYQALGHEVGSSFLVARSPEEIESVSGSTRVERARIRGREDEVAVELVFVRFQREPDLSLAKALGCRSLYDRKRRFSRLTVGDGGETSVPGIFAAGDVVKPSSLEESIEAGRQAGSAAARFAMRAS